MDVAKSGEIIWDSVQVIFTGRHFEKGQNKNSLRMVSLFINGKIEKDGEGIVIERQPIGRSFQ